ncbi:aminotransferase class III-fold pyridoxal phosphate-dependent enzyme [Micrococcus sp. ACRRV]|nr:aminotransferase class III-fold pyridoxal phosphate-dependent enzyme [Micrococcus sp. ACRRV]
MADGNERICATSGLWNVNFGYGRHEYRHALTRQLETLSYYPNFRYSSNTVDDASESLLALTTDPYSRVVWSTGGAMGVEAAIKIARVFHALQGEMGRRHVAANSNAYHGVSIGTMSVTDEDYDRRFYGVPYGETVRLSLNDEIDRKAVGPLARRLAAIIVEPVAGTGTIPLTSQALATIGELQAGGVLVIVDEVATGFGRVSKRFASEEWDLVPDLLVVSKGLTNGTVPGGAVLLGERVTAALSHAPEAGIWQAETGAGHPLAAAAAMVSCAILSDPEQLALHAEVRGQLQKLCDEVTVTSAVITNSGAGAFQTLKYQDNMDVLPNVVDIVDDIRSRGVLVHPSPRGVQLIPPLITPGKDLETIVEVAASVMETRLNNVL